MADMEKVIKGLEMCTKPTPSYCRQCPYRGIPDDYPHCVHDRLQQDALALLKKQEAQKFFVDESGNITPLPIVFPNRPMKYLVEVVRCRDCAYALFKEDVVEPGHIVCTKPYTERWQAIKPNNWFCADGIVKYNCSEFPNSSVGY